MGLMWVKLILGQFLRWLILGGVDDSYGRLERRNEFGKWVVGRLGSWVVLDGSGLVLVTGGAGFREKAWVRWRLASVPDFFEAETKQKEGPFSFTNAWRSGYNCLPFVSCPCGLY